MGPLELAPHVCAVIEEAGISRSHRWLTAMVVSRLGNDWEAMSKADQMVTLKSILKATRPPFVGDGFREFPGVRGLDEWSSRAEEGVGPRKPATVIVSEAKYPEVRSEEDVVALLRPLVDLGDKVSRGLVAERAVAVTLREAGFRLEPASPEIQRRVFADTKLAHWDLLVWDPAGRSVILAIEVKNLTGLAVRLSEFKNLIERMEEAADLLDLPSVIVVPKATKQFRGEARFLGGSVVESDVYLVDHVDHQNNLHALTTAWPVLFSREGNGVPGAAAQQLVDVVLAEADDVGWSGPWSGGPWVLTDEQRAMLREERRLRLTQAERDEVRHYAALRRMLHLEDLLAEGFSKRDAARRLGVDRTQLRRDAERMAKRYQSGGGDSGASDHPTENEIRAGDVPGDGHPVGVPHDDATPDLHDSHPHDVPVPNPHDFAWWLAELDLLDPGEDEAIVVKSDGSSFVVEASPPPAPRYMGRFAPPHDGLAGSGSLQE